MFPTPLRHSAHASTRPSMLGGGGVPSEENLSRLRSRLRQSGAIMSSRSVASRADVLADFEVVDVGEGHHPTGVEQLLARLEQHGLRRRLATEDDASAYAVDMAVRAAEEEAAQHRAKSPAVDSSEEGSGAGHDVGCSHFVEMSTSSQGAVSRSVSASRHGEDSTAREPYYYLCVPCELRLTRISRQAPPWRALEDVHFHFSSAAHRSTAAWMADDDIDATLRSTPLVTPTSQYSRIFVNGVPTLLSRRPGGGDMFYPLPHEVDAVRPAAREHMAGQETDASSRASSARGSQPFQLFPSATAHGEGGGQAVLWHRALPSIYTTDVQLLRRAGLPAPVQKPARKSKYNPKVYRIGRRRARAQVHVDHVDLRTYRAHSQLPPSLLPLTPVVLPIHRARIPKILLQQQLPAKGGEGGAQAAEPKTSLSVALDDPHRRLYTQAYEPLAEGWRDFVKQGGGDRTTEPPAPLTVFEEESYRVALVSAAEQHRCLRRQSSFASRESAHEDAPVVLTRELLTQHTQSALHGWRSPTDSNVNTSMASSMSRTSGSRPSSTTQSSLPPSRSRSETSSHSAL